MNPAAIEQLKQRARAGDQQALQELRESGFFEQQKRARKGYAASHAQERLWLLDRMNEGSTAYNVPGSILLNGPFNAALFWAALRQIVQRHEALRTTFDSIGGEVRQFVHDEIELDEAIVDLSQNAHPMQDAREWALREASHVFDLQRGPLLRARVLRLGDDAHVFLFNLHHSICDEWSLGVLMSELSAAYEARLENRQAPLAPLTIQYKDFAAWQNKKLVGDSVEPLKAYWHEKLAGVLPRLDLPLDYPRPALQTQAGDTVSCPLDADALAKIQSLGQKQQASLFVALTALVKAFLYRYTGQDDIVIGAPFAGRTHPGVENMIGFFVNTVCLRDRVSGRGSFIDLLPSVQNTVAEAIAHQDYPFDRLVSEIETERDPSRSPLFDVVISLQHGGAGAFRLGEAVGAPLDSGFDTAKFDLIFDFSESADGLLFRLNYNTDLFSKETIQRMGAHFAQLLLRIAADPGAPLRAHPILSEEETRRAIHDWNATAGDAPTGATIVSLFEAQAGQTPHRAAVVFEDASLTYADLNQRANQIARRIQREMQCRPDERIAIFLDRSDWMVAAILGVQKAGAAYVPVDPAYPQERIRFMLEDCGCRLVVSEARHLETVRGLAPSLNVIDVRGPLAEDGADAASPLAPDSAAYIIYTSGSTGKPKGCVVTHRNVVRLMVNQRHPFAFSEDDVWVAAHSFCFDFSVWEMYGALLYGGRLVVAPRSEVRDAESFLALIQRHRVTVLNQTPAAFYNLIAQETRAQAHRLNEHLRYVIFGGDRLEPTYLRPWVERYPLNQIALINMYGITETTVHVTYYQLQSSDVNGAPGASPIGTPIPGVAVYVCNEGMQLQPPGVAGELFVGGDGVCREYLNRKSLTQERFIENPFGLGGRLYRSGDVGRWSIDGALEHLGRNDDQVQVRGFRVELGEIESAIAQHPAVGRCVTLAQGGDAASIQLVAYIAPDGGNAAPLQRVLQSRRENPGGTGPTYELPNGLTIAHQNKSESDFLYEEIFERNAYLKNGIEIHQGDCIIDVGGNIGLFSVFAALQQPNVTLYAFEPVPPVYACLRRNLQWYSPRSRAFELGLSNQAGKARFVYFPYNTVVSGKGVDANEVRRLVKTYLQNELQAQGRTLPDDELEELLEERMQSQRFDCELTTLSAVIREQAIERIDLLKIDVEQSEYEVLLGVADDDWAKIAQVAIEVHDADGRLEAVTTMLERRGFSLCVEQDQSLINTNLFNVFAVHPSRRPTPKPQASGAAVHAAWCGEQSLLREIRKQIAPLLPDYMAPASFVFVDAFPLTANGKIDRKQLAQLSHTAADGEQALLAPRNEKEKQLAALWRSVLGRDDVGVLDNFFERGGHSLKATQLVARIHQEMNVKIPLRLVFQRPTIAALALAIQSKHIEAFQHIRPAPAAPRYPLSHAQRRLWLIERMGADRLAYVISEAFHAPGDLDVSAFQRALSELAQRHESLRTVIVEEEDQPWQIVLGSIEAPLEIIDQRKERLPDEDERARILEQTKQPFDLSRGPLFRVALFQFAGQRNIVVFTIHHIISDGWSMDVMLNELAQLYEGCRSGAAPSLPELRLQYKDYASWQNQWLQSGDIVDAQQFWLNQFADGVPVLELPTDRPRPAVQTYRGDALSFELDAALAQRLWKFGRDRGASAFVTALAVVNALLGRYAIQDDIVVGSPVAGREHADLEGLVGFFVNMLPLRSRINRNAGFAALLEQVRDEVGRALNYQAYPFDRLVEELEIQRDLGRSPLFDVAVTFHNQRPQTAAAFASGPYALQTSIAKFDLTFFFSELPGGRCGVGVEYNLDLFDRSRIKRMASHLRVLIESLLSAPQAALHSLPLMAGDERRRVVEAFNQVAAEYPATMGVAQLFEQQAEQTPQRTALICGGDQLTYQQLNQSANALAKVLLDRCQLQPEQRVGVLMKRSQRPLIAALAILKAGGAYVPLDPAYPQSRIQYMLHDAQCRVVISETALIEACAPHIEAVEWIDASLPAEGVETNPAPRAAGASLAYVIYTSGSTGEPKGSLIEQRSITRLVKNTNYIQISETDCILQTGSLSFDASTFEIWGALLNGASVCLPHEDDLLDPRRLAELVNARRVSVLFLTTSLLNQMVEANIDLFRPLRVLLTGGEKVSVKHINRVRHHCPGLVMLHVYGPTENTTFSTYYPIEGQQRGDVPIGGPIANSTLYILDERGQPQPIGVPGEICLGGDGVARGYLNRDAQTQEKFVRDPFSPGGKLYRSGDLGVWNADGAVSFIGRIDNQVKVRGFRVEPGEIEIRLQQIEEVNQAAVVARETSIGTKELVAYFSTRGVLSAAQLRQRLANELPDYMVPARLIAMEQLPLNRNGKIDRKRLPEPDAIEPPPPTRAAPRNDAEHMLLQVWQSVLGRTSIGVHDNYFAVGGDSIRAIQIVSRLRRMGWQVEIRHLFQYLTVAELAPRLTCAQEVDEVFEVVEGPVELTPIQRWFFDQHDADIHHFNQAVMLKPSRPVDAAALKEALQDIWRRHDALRMQFHQPRGAYQQYNRGVDVPVDFEVVDCRGRDDERAALDRHAEAAQAGFDLQNTPLMKAVLYQTTQGDRLLWAIHHLVVDGVSWRILLEDIENAYRARLEGEAAALPARTASYQQWALALQRFAGQDALLNEAAYWRQALTQTATEIPFDNPSSENVYGDCDVVQVQLSAQETETLLTRAHRAYSTEMNDLLLAALGRALQEWTGGASFWIALEGHGREALPEAVDVGRTVGWFTSMYPFHLSLQGAALPGQIKSVKEALRAAPRKGMGYGVLRYLAGPAQRGELPTPPTPVSFNYLGQFGASGDDGLFTIVDEPCGKTLGARLPRQFDLEIIAVASDGRMALSVIFNQTRHHKQTIQTFLEAFRRELVQIAAHCSSQTVSQKTPSDFTARLFTLPQYQDFLQTHGWRAEDIEDAYPLSPMQQGLLFQSLYQPGSQAYFLQTSFRLQGLRSVDAFQRSWQALCQRHAILRTAFVHDGAAAPLQVVFKQRRPDWNFESIAGLPPREQRAVVVRRQEEERRRGFHLTDGPLMRIHLFALGGDEYQVIWSYHHLLLDGWCLRIVYQELDQLYGAFIQQEDPGLPTPPPYGEYIAWLQAQDAQKAKAYWAGLVAGHEQTAALAKRLSSPDEYVFQKAECELSEALTGALQAAASISNVTLNTVIQTALGLALQQHNDCDDVIIGSIVSGRAAQVDGVEDMLGLFINALPVRLTVAGDDAIADVLAKVQQQTLASEAFSYYPLAEIQALAGGGRDLFDALMIFANYPTQLEAVNPEGGREAHWTVGQVENFDQTHYDLNLIVVPGGRLQLKFHYNGAVYDGAQIARLIGQLKTVFEQMAQGLSQRVRQLSVLPSEERDAVIHQFNQTRVDAPPFATVIDAFAEQVRTRPAAVALQCQNQTLTYGALNQQANRFAHELSRRVSLQPDDLVGVLLDRSTDLVAAILGIMKSGAAYVPIDPAAPDARIEHILQDSGCKAIVTEARRAARVSGAQRPLVLAQDVGSAPCDDPQTTPGAHDLAYVIYTSGSTGLPKGCLIEHRNLAHYLNWANDYYYGGRDGGCMGLHTSISIDMTVTSLFLPLLRGKTLHVFGRQDEAPDMLAAMFKPGSAFDCVKLTPSHVSVLQELGIQQTDVSLAIVGGEALPLSCVRCLHQLNPAMRVVNEYGPTETTVGCVAKEVLPGDARVLIGQPIDNMRAYVLDHCGRPAPIGGKGELYLGGAGVARGYHNRDQLTREKFVENPLAPGETLYRTGDVCVWLDDGNLDYLGRNDDQVKVRGYRVELGEIEQQIQALPGVIQAAVALRAVRGEDQLVAYYTADHALDTKQLQIELSRRLPDYCLPYGWLYLEEMPLSSSGKVDKPALPTPQLKEQGAAAPPRTPAETQLAHIWREVLQVDSVGVHDRFFDLGGHSLKAMQAVSRIHKRLGVKVALRDLFSHPTIAQLAALIETSEQSDYQSIEPAPPQEVYGLSYAQQRLWFIQQAGGEEARAAYNMPKALLIEDAVNVDALNRAFAQLLERHEALRTGFVEIDGEPKQTIHAHVEFSVRIVCFDNEPQPEAAARRLAEQDALAPFDLARPPLLRATLIALGDQRSLFVLTVNHIIGDGWSMPVLFRDLLAFYQANLDGRAAPLKPLRIQYKDFAHWQNRRSLNAHEAYWLERLKGKPDAVRLPYDRPPNPARAYRGGAERLLLDAPGLRALRNMAKAKNTTLSNVVLAFFYVLLYQWTKQDDLCVGVSIANRTHADIEGLIGFFVNILPVRVRVSAQLDLDDLLARVIDATQDAYEHQDYPFDQLVQKLNPQRAAARQPLVNIVYGFQNFSDIHLQTQAEQALESTTGSVKEFDLDFKTAKFDLTLFASETDDGLELNLEYDASLFEASSARRLLDALGRFMQSAQNQSQEEN